MKLTGHKTEAVYRRYAITSAADLSEGVAKLATLHSGSVGARSVLPFITGTVRAHSGGRAFVACFEVVAVSRDVL